MNSKQGRETLAELKDRYDIELEIQDWQSQKVSGGAGSADEFVAALAFAAKTFDDTTATVYEMESVHKEFAPMNVPLSEAGFQALRQNLISHFDIVMIPPSRQWAFVMSHELDGLVCGPKNFLSIISHRSVAD